MNETKWTLGEPCLRSLRNKSSYIVEPISPNKREIVNEKINERHMISQIGQNPFLKQNKYLEDLNMQEIFLKPKNSNFREN